MTDLFSLVGRTALIIGGSSGIGRMIATGFLNQGATTVYIVSENSEACNQTATQLSTIGNCIPIIVDISTLSGIQELFKIYCKYEDKLDILVNSIGISTDASFQAFTEEKWELAFNLNLKAPFFIIQTFIDLLKKSTITGIPAKVINISSVAGLSVNARTNFSYTASKAGLIHLTKHLALHLVHDNIILNTIAPGAFISTMNVDAISRPTEIIKRIPCGRIGNDNDIAGAAIYLASRAGDYVIGTTLAVDGGALILNEPYAGLPSIHR